MKVRFTVSSQKMKDGKKIVTTYLNLGWIINDGNFFMDTFNGLNIFAWTLKGGKHMCLW
jgi:hypothetical protein